MILGALVGLVIGCLIGAFNLWVWRSIGPLTDLYIRVNVFVGTPLIVILSTILFPLREVRWAGSDQKQQGRRCRMNKRISRLCHPFARCPFVVTLSWRLFAHRVPFGKLGHGTNQGTQGRIDRLRCSKHFSYIGIKHYHNSRGINRLGKTIGLRLAIVKAILGLQVFRHFRFRRGCFLHSLAARVWLLNGR